MSMKRLKVYKTTGDRMRNKFLISCITLIVFFNFTIPSYALAAPAKAFSRNAKSAPVIDEPANEKDSALIPDSFFEGGVEESVTPKEISSPSGIESVNYDPRNVDLSKVDWSLYAADQIYVQLKDNAKEGIVFDLIPDDEAFAAIASLEKIAQDFGINKTKRLFKKLSMEHSLIKNVYKIGFSGRYPIADLIQALQKDENVEYAEPVPIYKTFSVPDDPYYPAQQWGLSDINPQPAWDVYEQNPGNPVVVAVVDDAVALTHEDLQANAWVNPAEIPGNGIDDDDNGWVDDVNGYDVADNDPNPNPPATATNTFFHHGTHVAGITAGVTDNSVGMASVGRNNIKIMAVKTKKDSNTNPSTLDDTASGVAYAIMAGADVINMSWGSFGTNNTLTNLMVIARDMGIVLVAAAGNTGTLQYAYPASYEHVISVGALQPGNLVASFSTYNDQVDVMAPGLDILSTLPGSSSSYGELDGTSMAAPFVSGLCALIYSYNPSLSPDQVELIIKNNCIDITALNPNYTGYLGSGKVNAGAALTSIVGGVNIPFVPFSGGTVFQGISILNNMPAWGDYDNDGDLDLVLAGVRGSELVTEIHRNDGNGVFTNIEAGLEGFGNGHIEWGDYDNDGDLDLLICGHRAVGPVAVKIYRNDGSDIFTAITASFNSAYHCKWGDYNNDGALDIFVASFSGFTIGRNNKDGTFTQISTAIPISSSPSEFDLGDYDNDGDIDVIFADQALKKLRIFKNEGSGVFADSGFEVPNIDQACSLKWGDYDSDGLLDFLLVGYYYDSSVPGNVYRAEIYHNDGNNVFTNIQASLPNPVGRGSWADYDNDGDLDVSFAGNQSLGWIPYPLWTLYLSSKLKIYKNENGNFSDIGVIAFGSDEPVWADYDNDGDLDVISPSYGYSRTRIYINNTVTTNAVPQSPANLQASVSGNDVTLSWQKAADTQTPSNGLSYNVYMGTTPGAINTASPMAQLSDGLRKVAKTGSERAGPGAAAVNYTIKSLDCNTTYYWGVQTIDSAFAGSTFAAGTPFTTDACSGIFYTVSGVVTENGQGLSGVEIKFGSTVLATTNSSGAYSFSRPSGWSGTVIPFKNSYTFTPPSKAYVYLNYNLTNQNYSASSSSYAISGVVMLGNQGLPDVQIKEGNAVLATTNSSGVYSFSKASGWTGTVAPSLAGHTFTPANRSYTNLNSNQSAQDYAAGSLTYTVSGTVLNAGGQVIAGATVNGQAVAADGSYSFTVNYGQNLTVTPAASGYTFTPPSATFNNITSNQTQNFVGNLLTYTVSGTVLNANNQPIAGATVNGQAVAADGSYSFTVNYGQNLTVTPAASGYTFTPPSATFNNITSNQTQNFVGAIAYFSISGSVYTPNGPGIGFAINVTNANPNLPVVASTVSQPDGTYLLSVPYGWSGSVQAVKAGYIVIDPQNGVRSYDNVTLDQAEMNYKTISENYTISGLIKYADGSGPVADVQLKDDANNVLATTTSDGSYSFEKEYGWSGVVTPYKSNHVFDPQNVTYANLQENKLEEHYKAQKSSIVISGQIVSSPNDMFVGGVTLRDNEGLIVATTDGEGKYSFEKPIGWSGIITPSKPKYVFIPQKRKYENVQTNLSQEHYVAKRL